MANKLTTISFLISAFIVIITIVIASVPNLISCTLSLSLTNIKDLRDKLSAMPGMIQPRNYDTALPGSLTTPQPTRIQPLNIGDYRLGVSLGIWRCGFEITMPKMPVQITWGGSYVSLGDNFEATANQMMATIDKMGVAKMLLGDEAVPAIAGLIRTMFVRAEIEVTVALLFAIIAMVMTFTNMCVREGQANPLVISTAAICHLIHSILLGVALGAFAQQLQQISSMANIYAILKISDKEYGILVLGFFMVLASVFLAVAHFRMLFHPNESYKRFGKSEDQLAYPPRENFKLSGEYDV
ncbi:uncharacterized protein LOC132544116 [Ylistrum balloti]|uniref:uncharacterized protein LOC132544116 n=1 Tax=Ylistrum balloti TaxID=509963 RepID=UPI002905922F|nr:uncharacterized protein LOC132544116 [Ylistrum balloti]